MSYLGHSMGREMGFLAAWAIISAEVIIPSALYVVLAPILNSVLQQYFHFSVPLWVCAIVLCALVTGITVLGIRGSSNVAVALSLFEIGVFLVLAITLIRAPFAAGRAGEGTGSGVHGDRAAHAAARWSAAPKRRSQPPEPGPRPGWAARRSPPARPVRILDRSVQPVNSPSLPCSSGHHRPAGGQLAQAEGQAAFAQPDSPRAAGPTA
jgi:hypothetical protein